MADCATTDNDSITEKSKVPEGETEKIEKSKVSKGETEKIEKSKVSEGETEKIEKSKVSEGETEKIDKSKVSEAETEKTETTEKSNVSEGEKEKAKDESSHSDAVARHYNELQETGLESRAQSRIFYLRNFNNWIKSMLIADTLQRLRKEGDSRREISVLDLCSGKGGDLRKWEKGRINKLICADIAQTSVEQAEDRYSELIQRNKRDRYPRDLFTAEFIAADCTKVRLKDVYKDSERVFDLVSCQFSFHYCFESYQQADVMLRNACECLQDGGYFIGSTPNSQEIMRRLGESESNSFGNDVYRVTFPEGFPENRSETKLFGAKYDFHLEGVVDCPEFLVYFPALEKMAEEYGLKLIYKKPFADFFADFQNEGEGKSLLGKMQALESYPADREEKLMGDDAEYEHAKTRLSDLEEQNGTGEDHGRRHRQKLGTLSQSEWEAISLYLVFVFQKVEKKQEEVTDVSEEKDENGSNKEDSGSEEEETRSEKEQGTKRPLEKETTEDEPQEKQSKTSE